MESNGSELVNEASHLTSGPAAKEHFDKNPNTLIESGPLNL